MKCNSDCFAADVQGLILAGSFVAVETSFGSLEGRREIMYNNLSQDWVLEVIMLVDDTPWLPHL